MKTQIIRLSIVIIILFCSEALWALDAGKIIAYPVPFNPRKGGRVLNIAHKSGVITGHVKVEIFDINGDLVFKRKYGQLPAVWNGHNESGNLVKPGLYILKIDVEDDSDHSQAKKIIRILINY